MLEVAVLEGVTVGRTRARLLATTLPYVLYFVDGLLIDTGPYSLRRTLRPFLRSLPIERVALTHLHEDHCGNAAWLAAGGLPILAPGPAVAQAPRKPRLPLYRRLIWGRRPPFEAEPLPEVLETPRHRFRVIPAPGHTPDEVLFLEEREGWLFTGDFYLAPRPRVVFKDEDLGCTLRSLEALADIDFRVLFDAHAGPLADGPALLARKRAYLIELRERVEALRSEGLSDEAIDDRLFPQRPLLTRVSRGEWSSLQMVRTVAGPPRGKNA